MAIVQRHAVSGTNKNRLVFFMMLFPVNTSVSILPHLLYSHYFNLKGTQGSCKFQCAINSPLVYCPPSRVAERTCRNYRFKKQLSGLNSSRRITGGCYQPRTKCFKKIQIPTSATFSTAFLSDTLADTLALVISVSTILPRSAADLLP
jgi:hypothetical protein